MNVTSCRKYDIHLPKMINKHIGIVGIKTNYSTKETGFLGVFLFFLKGGAHAHVAPPPPWLRPCISHIGGRSMPLQLPSMSCHMCVIHTLLDDVTHQSYPHSRLLVELMTHIQCESKPIANNGENLLPIVTNGYNFLSKLTFYNICYQW